MSFTKKVLLGVIVILIALFFVLDLDQYLNLDYLKSSQVEISAYFEAQPVKSAVIFFICYVIFIGLSLPAAGIMTLAGGAIFGLILGTVLVSFASVIGATLAFLASRFLFRDMVQTRFADSLAVINEGIKKEGAFYLFTLRLVPVIPFFILNLIMGLTPIKTLTFALVSQVGMLLPTIVFINAGTQLAKINKPGDILSPELIASFVLLGLLPLIMKKTVDYIKKRRKPALEQSSVEEI